MSKTTQEERNENRLDKICADQRLRILVLKDILERETDENHTISMERIQEELAEAGVYSRSGQLVDRRSLYDDITVLIERYEMSIQRYNGKDRSYNLSERDFELVELKLIADAILSSKLISEAQAKKIITKLKKLCSKYDASELDRSILYAGRIKSMNDSSFRFIDAIQRAINNNSQIQFKYYTRGFDYKQKVYKNHGRTRSVSPWALIYSDNFYYLHAYVENTKSFWNFRVDRMEGITELKTPRVGKEKFGAEDIAGYNEHTFGMFSNTVFVINLEFHIDLLSVVYDRFGKDVQKQMVDDKHFRVTTPIALSPQFYAWIFGLGDKAKIITPFAQEGMRKMLEDVSKLY